MNEEQKKAQEEAERKRFLTWAENYRNNTNRENFTLQTDIDLTGVDWVPIDFNQGNTFDGGGHTISGLKVTQEGSAYGDAGLFSSVTGSSTIKNLHVSGTVDVPGSDYAGGIAGFVTFSTIENVSFTGAVTEGNYRGGIIGTAYGSYFTNCHYKGPDDLKFLGQDDGTNRIKDCSPWP